MSRTENNNVETSFICGSCRRSVLPAESGTRQRNHCPFCLWSSHVDIKTGDRRSLCRGGMEPISVFVEKRGEWSIIHRCKKCGFIRVNRIAGDDDVISLLFLAVKPVANLPFPAEAIQFMKEGRNGY